MANIFFERIKKGLAGCMEKILADLLPGGKIQGNEYICATSTGGVGESCSTNIITGVDADFATDEAWGDIIDLASQQWKLPQGKAAERLAEKYLNNRMESDDVLLSNGKSAKCSMNTSYKEKKPLSLGLFLIRLHCHLQE